MKRLQTRSCHAFTLVEVLVAMAILMVLLAIVMPVYRASVGRAKDNQCVYNLKQVAVGALLYHEDWDGFPLNNAAAPELIAYLGGQALTCYARPSEPGSGYLTLWPREGQLVLSYNDQLRECYAKRGSSFPLIYDTNHTGARALVLTGADYMLLARADTSVHVIPGSLYRDAERDLLLARVQPYPCPHAPTIANL